ncbi:MAG: DUF4136 domain-containing protein [Rhodospirillaceae bacterium]|nr:DUF4136 domain-containing protein [Rhodospirillaceae bacterium]
MKLRLIAAAAVAAVSLTACVSPRYVTSDVTRFHTLPASPSGQTFAITALDREQEQSLEYRQYADLLNAKLTAMGLKQSTTGPAKADYVVTLKYTVDGPTPDVRSRTSGVSVGIGYGYYGRHNPWAFGGAYDPFYDNYTNTEQVYTRRVELNIYKGDTYTSPSPTRVFEGRALSEGLNGQLSPVMPYILDALFTDFPGSSGSTKTVRVEVPRNVDAANTAASPSARASY